MGASKARLFEFVDTLTDQPVTGSAARAVHSSGGAAGGVVSEGQGYGLLIAGTVLASLDADDSDRQLVSDLAYEMFLGWRRMCVLSAGSGSCQDDEGFECGGGQYPCLAHWKFGDDLTTIIGQGAAPDGDADALGGMLLATMAVEDESSRPTWYDEMGQWAYETCKQFYLSSTVASSSGKHRIVKLGSCWGGWGGEGQNPSYHAPGVYRLCKHFMATHGATFGKPSGEGASFEGKWDQVIDTTYKMFEADQCESTGLITNWAKVYEESDGQTLTASTGFSGSGTPGAEYGSEAARGVWRVALDYLLFPDDAQEALEFLEPVTSHLDRKLTNGNWAEALDIDNTCLVETVHPSWSWNMFMAGTTFSSLVAPSALSSTRQQELIDAAGQRVAMKSIEDYYSGSWIAIATMTLNGDLSKAAMKIGLSSASTDTTTSSTSAESITSSVTTSAGTTTTSTSATTSASSVTTSAPAAKVFTPVDGGDDRACRGASTSDNSNSHYSVVSATSIDACKGECIGEAACVGIEFKGTRCEIWTRDGGIQASKQLTGYTCLRYDYPIQVREGEFLPVDGGSNRVCRGSSASDNAASYFTVQSGVSSLESCQSNCREDASCTGVEYHVSGRCEIWVRANGPEASAQVDGYSCWRFEDGSTSSEREGYWQMLDGSVDRACRGSSASDNSASYFTVYYGIASSDSCKMTCRRDSNCKGIEYHTSSGRCEIWTRADGIQATAPVTGYTCWRFIEEVAS